MYTTHGGPWMAVWTCTFAIASLTALLFTYFYLDLDVDEYV